MPQDVSTMTMESEGYSPEDWLPYFQPFFERRDCEKMWSEEVSLKEYLNHPDNRTGGNPSYEWRGEEGKSAHVHFHYSPYLRTQHGLMLTGDVLIDPDWAYFPRQEDGYSFLREYAEMFFEESDVDYIHQVKAESDELDIVRIEIPESATPEEVSSTASQLGALLVEVTTRTERLYREKYGEPPEQEEKEAEDTTRDLLE